jgi:ribulose-phosphate 3-epimerase
MQKLGASIITMDHLNMFQEIQLLKDIGGVDYLHIDMMDGHFVPRYGIYPEIIQEISTRFDFELDVHLMVEDVEFALSQLSGMGNIDTISFHYSTNEGSIFKIIDAIKAINAKPILALDLSTSITAVSELLNSNELHGLLFMGIHPGVLKQEHRPNNVIRRLRELRLLRNLSDNLVLQIDGGFNFETACKLKSAGINSFVGGSSSIYRDVPLSLEKLERSNLIKQNIEKLKVMWS